MFKRLIVAGLVLVPGAAFAVDCSKMTPAQLRMVEDPKKDCVKPKVKKKEEPEAPMQKEWRTVRREIASKFKNPNEVQFRNIRATFSGGIFCGEVNGAMIYNGNEGFKIFYYISAVKPIFSFENDKDFSPTQFAKVCIAGGLELFPVEDTPKTK